MHSLKGPPKGEIQVTEFVARSVFEVALEHLMLLLAIAYRRASMPKHISLILVTLQRRTLETAGNGARCSAALSCLDRFSVFRSIAVRPQCGVRLRGFGGNGRHLKEAVHRAAVVNRGVVKHRRYKDARCFPQYGGLTGTA